MVWNIVSRTLLSTALALTSKTSEAKPTIQTEECTGGTRATGVIYSNLITPRIYPNSSSALVKTYTLGTKRTHVSLEYVYNSDIDKFLDLQKPLEVNEWTSANYESDRLTLKPEVSLLGTIWNREVNFGGQVHESDELFCIDSQGNIYSIKKESLNELTPPIFPQKKGD